uniref:CD44 antigen-like n=1 Tax=Pristiophorus japonicus TaxID=55135 RepID=UPI00398F1F38
MPGVLQYWSLLAGWPRASPAAIFSTLNILVTAEETWLYEDVKKECGHHGIIQMESGGRYQLDFRAAADLCQSLGTTLATLGQLKRAQAAGYETCRYGWIQDGLIAIPRVISHPVCGKNFVGVYTVQKPLTKLYDAFCFNVTEYENCGSEISASTPYATEQGTSRISNIPTTSGKSRASSLQITTEGPIVTSAKSHDIATHATMAGERHSSSLTPGPGKPSLRSSPQPDIQSTPLPSAAATFRESGPPEDQPTRPASSETSGLMTKSGTSPTTRPGYTANSRSKATSASLQKNTSVTVDGSGSAGDIELYTQSIKEKPLNPKRPSTSNKLEHKSAIAGITLGSVAYDFPSATFAGNALRDSMAMGSAKDHVNRLGTEPTLDSWSMLQINTKSEQESKSAATSSQPSEPTQQPTKFEIGRAGTALIRATTNTTNLAEEIGTSTGMLSSEHLLDHRAVGTPGRKEPPSPTDLTVESGSAPDTLSSDPANVLLDLIAVTVLDANGIPPNSPSPDLSGLLVESGSTPEMQSSEHTEAPSVGNTVTGNNRKLAISTSSDTAVLFVESGSTPEILKSESLTSVVDTFPDFPVTTAVGMPTSQQTATSSRIESDLPVRPTVQSVGADQTPSERLSGYLSTASMPSSTTPDPLTSLHHSPQVSSVVLPINADNKQETKPTTASSNQTTVQSKLTTPGRADPTRIDSTPGSGPTATTLTATNRVTQMSSFTVGTQQKAKPTSAKTSDLIILDDGPHLKSQPSTTAVGEKRPEASLDWLIVVAIVVSLLIILIGGAVIIYSKRLCGRKKSLVITRERDDNAAIVENGNGRDVEEDDLKANIKKSDEWIQLMNKDNVEAVPEAAEAARLMSGNESGEPSNRGMKAATQEAEDKS